MRGKHRLSATFVRHPMPGKHCDGENLWLHVRPDGGAQWVFRPTIHGRRREMGLGSLNNISLKQARELADKWRRTVISGSDPIKERRKEERELQRADNTLRTVGEEAFEARKAELRGDGQAGRWFSPLELHVLPKLGKVPVEEIDQRDVRDVLAPIWHKKSATAEKALNRLAIVLRHAASLGLDVDLQVIAKAQALLGKSRHKPEHIAAMPWADVPAFYGSLSEPTIVHLALRLLILTGVRSKPLRFLHLDHIHEGVWTVPAALMKGRRNKTSDFRVPLSSEACSVIDLARPFEREGLLFPSVRKGVISDASMSRLMERRGLVARPHGFRTSIRTWLSEAAHAPHEVAETVLAHVVGGKVQRSYLRTDFLDERRVLMECWSDFVVGSSGQVLKLVAQS